MKEVIDNFIAVVFAGLTIYFAFTGLALTRKFNRNVTETLGYVKLQFLYYTFSAISFFVVIQSLVSLPNCLPYLLGFIVLLWIPYLALRLIVRKQ